MKLLFIGDIYGRPGRRVVKNRLADLKRRHSIDFVLANCENLASGRGITEKTIKEMLNSGVNAFTGGNHLWDKKQSFEFLEKEKKIVKPLNMTGDTLGAEMYVPDINGTKIAVLNLIGQSFMPPADSPIFTLKRILPEIKKQTNCIFIDIHAEATAEKKAFAIYFDGEVTGIIGTHTHIQTADEQILEKGTAYITDVGMTGSHDSVIGVKKELIIQKIESGMPVRYEPAENNPQINAVLIEFDPKSGKSQKIERMVVN